MTDTASHPTASSINDLVRLLEADGPVPDEGGDRLTQLSHGLQCAAELRELRSDDLELQAAGLLHDIGHTLLPGEPALHGHAGAAYVRPLLGERVAELIRLHVDAKRYLVAVEPEYRASLSPGSVLTLIAQGEAMEAAEIEVFEASAYARDAVALRRADEAAKVPGRDVPGLEAWVPIIRRLAE